MGATGTARAIEREDEGGNGKLAARWAVRNWALVALIVANILTAGMVFQQQKAMAQDVEQLKARMYAVRPASELANREATNERFKAVERRLENIENLLREMSKERRR